MSRKFDYPDPGLDPEYCNGLSNLDDPGFCCAWCSEGFSDCLPAGEYYPYCSLGCSIAAERESQEEE